MKADVTLDPLGGEVFTTAVDAAAQQLSFEKGTGRAERRAAGLVAISRYFLEHHTDVTHRLGRPHIVANVPLAVLIGGSGSAVLGSGAVIDAATAHCRHPGCEAPAWACEAHHVIWWDGPYRGETTLTNLVLQCWQHHHLLHKDPGWRLELDPATRRLDVYYRDRLIGSTFPPGRQRTEPDVTPAHPTARTDESFDALDLFMVAGA